MSLGLRLYTGLLDGCPLPSTLQLADGTTIPQVFSRFSDEREVGGDIRITLDRTRESWTSDLPGNPATSLRLHQGLKRLTRNRANEPRVLRIGLIFANRYAHGGGGTLGAMFDRGFATDDDAFGGENQFQLPREGSALFLGAIQAIRPSSDEFLTQTFFTAVHELGHLFNLLHSSGTNYMAQSRLDRTHEPDYFKFSQAQVGWLSWCSDSPSVWPGGSPFRSRSSSDDALDVARQDLALSIVPSRTRMWPWEPVELEIELKLLESAEEPASIPNEVDPGYERLQIWIEDPSGERRLFRSPQHYCSSFTTIDLSPGQRFVRDVSLFGQSGGYTFREPGVHRIQAVWNPNTPAALHSTDAEIEILGPGAPLPSHGKLLRSPAAARLLYYRHGSSSSSVFRALEQYSRDGEAGATRAHVAYAVGRAHATRWEGARSTQSRKRNAAQALAALEYSAEEEGLGKHARSKCFQLLERIRQD